MALGPWQFNARLRQRFLNIHRWMGRSYVVAVLFGGLGGLALATRSLYGLVTHLGFALLAVLWLFATLQPYLPILPPAPPPPRPRLIPPTPPPPPAVHH